MTDESITTSTDGETEEFTRKQLHQELVTLGGWLLAIQLATLGVVLMDFGWSWLSIAAIIFGFFVLLIPQAANGNAYARSFFEWSSGEPIDWDAKFPEVDN